MRQRARGASGLLVGLVATLAVGGATAGGAADWPALEPGRWQFDRTIEGMSAAPQKVSRTDCLDPVATFRRQQEQLTRAGCTFTPLVRSGNRTSYSATCKMGGMTTISRSVLEADGSRAYTLTVDSEVGGKKTHELLVARRLGDCQSK